MTIAFVGWMSHFTSTCILSNSTETYLHSWSTLTITMAVYGIQDGPPRRRTGAAAMATPSTAWSSIAMETTGMLLPFGFAKTCCVLSKGDHTNYRKQYLPRAPWSTNRSASGITRSSIWGLWRCLAMHEIGGSPSLSCYGAYLILDVSQSPI